MYFADQMKKDDYVLLDNETIMLKVEIISATTLTCKIERGGFLGSYKDVFVPNVVFDMPNFSEKDKQDIEMAVKNQVHIKLLKKLFWKKSLPYQINGKKFFFQVDIIIAPFINSAQAILELKDLLGEKGKKMAVIANIQTIEGFNKFDEILTVRILDINKIIKQINWWIDFCSRLRS